MNVANQEVCISLLSVAGKLLVYGRVLIKRVRAGTECAIGEEQCGFRQGRRCMDQVFAIRQGCEYYLENRKDVFLAFMDLERHIIRSIGTVYGRCYVCMEFEEYC